MNMIEAIRNVGIDNIMKMPIKVLINMPGVRSKIPTPIALIVDALPSDATPANIPSEVLVEAALKYFAEESSEEKEEQVPISAVPAGFFVTCKHCNHRDYHDMKDPTMLAVARINDTSYLGE